MLPGQLGICAGLMRATRLRTVTSAGETTPCETVPWDRRICSKGSEWLDPLEQQVRGGVRQFLQELIEQEVTEALGRFRHGRAEGAKGYRHGHRPRTVIGVRRPRPPRRCAHSRSASVTLLAATASTRANGLRPSRFSRPGFPTRPPPILRRWEKSCGRRAVSAAGSGIGPPNCPCGSLCEPLRTRLPRSDSALVLGQNIARRCASS